MAPNNINFKLLSLNARGIRSFERRKALFGWLMKDKSDICFVKQRTVCIINVWGYAEILPKCFSRMVQNSVRVSSFKVDQNGRFIIIEANVQDHPFLFVNLYAPNKTNEHSIVFEEIIEELDNFSLAED